MKRMTDKAKIYEIFYKIVRAVLYFGVAVISIAYLVFLFIGQEKRFLLNAEITLLFAVMLLWQADILIRKKLYKIKNIGEKRDKKHTIAVCVALVGGTIITVSFAIMSFCNVSGAVALTVAVLTVLATYITAAALAFEYSISREIKAEERVDEAIAESDKKENAEDSKEEDDR